MKLVIGVDVEEEGLFSGRYPRTPPGVANVLELKRLEFIPREFGVPLTLLATFPVIQDGPAREVLGHFREVHGAEIGAHLHLWSTPPFADAPDPEPLRARELPPGLLRAKLARLVSGLKETLEVAPRAFRMGRFEAAPEVLGLLPEFGFRVDSSLVPLHRPGGDAGHFLAPAEPFFLPYLLLSGERLLEAPLTVVPLWAAAPLRLQRLAGALPGPLEARLLAGFARVGAVGIQPAWYPLASMCWAARLHRCRGGRVLNLFLHSSELKPGATPQFPSETAVRRLLRKIRAFLTWLTRTGPIQGLTLSGLYQEIAGSQGAPGPDRDR